MSAGWIFGAKVRDFARGVEKIGSILSDGAAKTIRNDLLVHDTIKTDWDKNAGQGFWGYMTNAKLSIAKQGENIYNWFWQSPAFTAPTILQNLVKYRLLDSSGNNTICQELFNFFILYGLLGITVMSTSQILMLRSAQAATLGIGAAEAPWVWRSVHCKWENKK